MVCLVSGDVEICRISECLTKKGLESLQKHFVSRKNQSKHR